MTNENKIELPIDIFQKNPVSNETFIKKLTGHAIMPEWIEKTEYPETGGIFLYIKGLKHPLKGLPYKEVVEAIGLPKKIIIGFLAVLLRTPLKYFLWLWWLLPKRIRKKIFSESIKQFVNVTDWMLSRYYLDSKRFCKSVKAVYDGGTKFVEENLPQTDHDVWKKLLFIGCMIMEYDNAYRYRIQDLVGELQLESLKKTPIRELKRVFKTAENRERTSGIDKKWRLFIRPLALMMFFNSNIKKNLVKFISSLNLDEIVLDHIDWYNVCPKNDYDYGGIGFPQRYSTWREETMEYRKQHGYQ